MIWEHTPRFRPVKRQSGREGGEEEEWAKEKGRCYKGGEADETVKSKRDKRGIRWRGEHGKSSALKMEICKKLWGS